MTPAALVASLSSHPGQSESVRDVQFSMKDYFTFAASFENGNVQLWDIRRPDRYERMFTAHNGPVFCCDWHPDDRYAKLSLCCKHFKTAVKGCNNSSNDSSHSKTTNNQGILSAP